MDLELGQAKHGWQNSNALTEPHLEFTAKLKAGTDPVSKGTDLTFPSYPRCLAEPVGMDELESLIRYKRDMHACITEYRAGLERLMSSIDARLEQSSAHHQTGRRMVYQVQLLSILHLLFMVAMYTAYYFGFIDIRPWSWSIARYILAAETGLFTFLVLLRMWEHYEHDQRRPHLDEFSSKFDFERMPALKERCGEQKWKEMQECSDVSLVLEKFEAIFRSACDDIINPKFQISGVKNVGNLTVGCP